MRPKHVKATTRVAGSVQDLNFDSVVVPWRSTEFKPVHSPERPTSVEPGTVILSFELHELDHSYKKVFPNHWQSPRVVRLGRPAAAISQARRVAGDFGTLGRRPASNTGPPGLVGRPRSPIETKVGREVQLPLSDRVIDYNIIATCHASRFDALTGIPRLRRGAAVSS